MLRLLLIGVFVFTSVSISNAAEEDAAVTRGQFNQLVRVFKQAIRKIDQIDKRLTKLEQKGGEAGGDGEQPLDLGGLEFQSPNQRPAHGSGGTLPGFKFFFDFMLVNRPGIHPLTFDSYHQIAMVEYSPSSDLQFGFEIPLTGTGLRYFEVDYKLTQKLQLRLGKIWIPFDDMAPHNIFGGRVNVSKLSLNSADPFLPDLWTDLGVGLKYQITDTENLSAVSHLYVVNGFRDGGTDPTAVSSIYPNFGSTPIASDNNGDKAIGGRVHAKFLKKFGLGGSVYRGRWSSPGNDPAKIFMTGIDFQFRPITTNEIRFGYIRMSVGLPAPGTNFVRGGIYVEDGQRFGDRNQYKLLVRGGKVQHDSRLVNGLNDMTIVGGAFLWQPALVQWSIEHNRDLQRKTASKTNVSFTALRAVFAF